MAFQSYNLIFKGYYRVSKIQAMPDDSGVYCAYAGIYNNWTNTASLQRLLYIGEADFVKTRISGHNLWDKWKNQLWPNEELFFSMAEISPPPARKRAEAAMIVRHKPPCNIEYVNNFPFEETAVATGGENLIA